MSLLTTSFLKNKGFDKSYNKFDILLYHSIFKNTPNLRKVYVLMHKITTFIHSKLEAFPSKLTKWMVMEKLIGSKIINSHLPYYFSLLLKQMFNILLSKV